MPQSPEVVRHAAFWVPLCGSAISVTAGVWRSGVSEIQPGAVFGTTESSNPGLTSTFGPNGPDPNPVVMAKLSKTAVLRTAGSWLVTANPPRTVGPEQHGGVLGIDTVVTPTVVHEFPSGEISPVN